MEMRGTVSRGLGRAHIFMAQTHYQEQFKKVLGVTAWPGTLNLKVRDKSFINYLALRERSGVETSGLSENLILESREIDTSKIVFHRIQGFEREGRSFGGATAIIATINHIDGIDQLSSQCAILIPDLTRHKDVVEIISPIFLREQYDLVDGDELSINY
ncbi:MAG: hypothetical protein CMO20_02380 [Thermoplasmata archaeon]|nr:hypothetical protein [Thermoplasmata archaeon]|tara:strand:+ start:38 stop:514 length:477 start_codon:yes stop_codon:yes gene_type:complete